VDTLLTFTEYSSKTIQGDLGWQLDDPRLDLLEKLNIQSKETLFTVGHKTIKATQFVGLVRIGHTTLQVLPKISYSGDFSADENSPMFRDAVRSATKNFLVMLSVACDLPIKVQQSTNLFSEKSDWLEILTRLFVIELTQQIQSGIHQEYVNLEDQLPTIKGRWLFDKQFRKKSLPITRFDVSYDEYSPDTTLNQIFLVTVDELLKLTHDPTNRSFLLNLHNLLNTCNPNKKCNLSEFSKVHFSRLNERFRPAFNIAKLFWEQKTVQLTTGETSAFSFSFDMNRLFQDYVTRIIQKNSLTLLPNEWQEAEVISQSHGYQVYLAKSIDQDQKIDRQVFRMIPDILITAPPRNPFLIIDTKYKKLNRDTADKGVSESDIYQMLAYSQSWKCERILMIYPGNSEKLTNMLFTLLGQNKVKIQAIELNLNQDLRYPAKLLNEIKVGLQPDMI
jgi:5-methylcytosine-specific restriction enzyme subunit McrC